MTGLHAARFHEQVESKAIKLECQSAISFCDLFCDRERQLASTRRCVTLLVRLVGIGELWESELLMTLCLVDQITRGRLSLSMNGISHVGSC